MSAISNIQSQNLYNFSIEKPTQSMNKKVLIEQSVQGLKISIKDDSSQVYQVEKSMTEGLPKSDKIPSHFFERCSIIAKKSMDSEYKVYFRQPLLGGMWNLKGHDVTEKTTNSISIGASVGGMGGEIKYSHTTEREVDCGNKDCPTSFSNPNYNPDTDVARGGSGKK